MRGGPSPGGWKKNPPATANERKACATQDQGENALPDGRVAGEEQDGRDAERPVADDTAEAGREWPPRGRGEGRSETGRAGGAHEPADDPQPFAVDRFLGEKAPAPQRQGQKDGERSDAEELHEDVGRGGTG